MIGEIGASELEMVDPLITAARESLDLCAADPTLHTYLTLRIHEDTPETHYRKRAWDWGPGHIHHEMQVNPDNMPDDTDALLSGLYELTNAEVVRDDLGEDGQRGVIIRKGEYNGAAVFFRERYHELATDSPYYRSEIQTSTGLTINVLGATSGEQAVNEVSLEQREVLAKLLGEEGVLRFVGADHEAGQKLINRENFEAIGELIGTVLRPKKRLARLGSVLRSVMEDSSFVGGV